MTSIAWAIVIFALLYSDTRYIENYKTTGYPGILGFLAISFMFLIFCTVKELTK